MVDIQSKEVIDKIADELKIQPAEAIPRKLNDSIQPTYNVNPRKVIKVINGGASDSVSTQIFATNSKKITYITAISMSVSKDVVSPSIVSGVSGTPFGEASKTLLNVRYEPLTAMSGVGAYINFGETGLRMANGSSIIMTNSSATASIDARATIVYYELDPI